MLNQALVNEMLSLIRECGIKDPEDGDDFNFLAEMVEEMKANEARVVNQQGFLSQLQYICGQYVMAEGIARIRDKVEEKILINASGGWVECSCMIGPTKRCKAQEFRSKAVPVGQGFYCRECAARERIR